MIWKIITATFGVSLFFAIVLYLAGVRYVGLDDNFMRLLQLMSTRINRFSIEIPMIPQINGIGTQGGLIEGLVNFVNGLVGFFNFLIFILNMLVKVVNFMFAFLSTIVAYLGRFGAYI